MGGERPSSRIVRIMGDAIARLIGKRKPFSKKRRKIFLPSPPLLDSVIYDRLFPWDLKAVARLSSIIPLKESSADEKDPGW